MLLTEYKNVYQSHRKFWVNFEIKYLSVYENIGYYIISTFYKNPVLEILKSIVKYIISTKNMGYHILDNYFFIYLVININWIFIYLFVR